jgi:hypothetical protein
LRTGSASSNCATANGLDKISTLIDRIPQDAESLERMLKIYNRKTMRILS